MKIGFVIDDGLDKPDGVQQYIITLGGWLISQGHEIHYITGETYRKDIPNIHSLGKNITLNFNGNTVSTPMPVNAKKIDNLYSKHKFDVLHVQLPLSPFLAGRVIKKATKKTAVIGTFHILPYSKLEKWSARSLRVLIRRPLKRLDHTFSVSEPAARFAKKSLGIRSTVMPNVIDTRRFLSSKKITKYDDGKINIVFLGRLVERKGCRQFLEAVSRLHEKNITQNVRVLICGKGPELAKLKDFVHKKRLSHIVNFVGFVSENDKPKYLSLADIAVFPSLGGESFGIVLLEAMAASKGVVLAGDNQGYVSVLGDRPKQIVDPFNTQDFTKKLKHFITSKRARDDASRWQREAVKQYDVRSVGKKIVETYISCLQNITM